MTWTTGDSGNIHDDIQLRSLMISSTKLDSSVRDEKNNCLSLGIGFNNMLEEVKKQASIFTSDQLRMHPSSADSLKRIDSISSINQACVFEHQQETVPMERHALEEDIQQFLKQDRLFAKYCKNPDCTRHSQIQGISLDAAWTQALDTLSQKCICRKNPVDLIHSRFNNKPRAEIIFTLSAFAHLFTPGSMDSMLPLVSSCFSGISMLQHIIPFLPRDDRKERKSMFKLQSDNAAVDSNSFRTSVTAQTLNANKQNTTLPVISISLVEGGHILLSKIPTHSINIMLGF